MPSQATPSQKQHRSETAESVVAMARKDREAAASLTPELDLGAINIATRRMKGGTYSKV